MLLPLTAVCLAAAAHAYQLPTEYLYAILAVEGGQVGQVVQDRNGTRDLGPFQINTTWGSAAGRFWGIATTEALVRLRDDGCANAVVAAAILKQSAIDAAGDMPTALGFYHSHRTELADRYRARALTALASLATPAR